MQTAPSSRNTRQKEAIRAVFLEADRPLAPEETLALVQQQGQSVSIATVYRNIASLIEDRWLTTIDVPGQAARYEVAGKAHHHHFQCTDCNTVYELSGCVMKTRPKLPRGFTYSAHEFFVYGTCATCKR